MTIQYWGHSCFKIIEKEITIATDPFPKEIGLKEPRFSADILTISHQHWDHNFKEAIKNSPFIIDQPGEYEIKGIFIKGIPSFHDDCQGKKRGVNTIFSFEIGGINLVHFGDFGQSELTEEQLGELTKTDILLLPVGGFYTIGPKEAHKIILKLEPRIVIPMHYFLEGLKIKEILPLDNFLTEMGVEKNEKEKLTIKKNDLKEGEVEIICLKPLAAKK